jgi:hypothetical protein
MSDRLTAAEMIAKLEKDAEERGYQRGVRDGIRSARQALEALEGPEKTTVIPDDYFNTLVRAPHHGTSRKPPANSVVLGAIVRAPGLTGRQLVDRCAAEGTPIEERTLRTALFRLRLRGEIKKIGDGWHPTETPGRELPLHENKGVFS